MYIIEDILVTTDFSPYSSAAVEYAKSFALLYAANIHVLNVIEDSMHHTYRFEMNIDAEIPPRIENREELMTRFIGTHLPGRRNIIPVIRFGKPHEEIVRYASEEGIDLIVIATHGHTGFEHIVIGSVAEKVVRQSPIPVLAIKPQEIREKLITQEDIEINLHLRSVECV